MPKTSMSAKIRLESVKAFLVESVKINGLLNCVKCVQNFVGFAKVTLQFQCRIKYYAKINIITYSCTYTNFSTPFRKPKVALYGMAFLSELHLHWK